MTVEFTKPFLWVIFWCVRKGTYITKRPFGCEYCEKRFTQSQAAKKHERIHTGEKPFGCKICDYKSNDSGNLRNHVKKINGGDKFAISFVIHHKKIMNNNLLL